MLKLLPIVAASLFAGAAAAEEITIDMWTMDPQSHERNSFSPGVVAVNPGDTVVWVAKEAGHNVEFMPGAVPAGAAVFKSGFEKEVRYTFEKPGVYAYKCLPHYGLGMVGFIVVGGDYANLEQVKATKFPGMANARASHLLGMLEELKK